MSATRRWRQVADGFAAALWLMLLLLLLSG
jgi:hypothetical protein